MSKKLEKIIYSKNFQKLELTTTGKKIKNNVVRDFPGSPVFKTLSSQSWRHGFNPWFLAWGIKIPHAARLGQKRKRIT